MHPDRLIVDTVTDSVWETGEPNKGWRLSDVTLTGQQVGAMILASTDNIGPEVEKAIDWDDFAALCENENSPALTDLAVQFAKNLIAAARLKACEEILLELETRSIEEAEQIEAEESGETREQYMERECFSARESFAPRMLS